MVPIRRELHILNLLFVILVMAEYKFFMLIPSTSVIYKYNVGETQLLKDILCILILFVGLNYIRNFLNSLIYVKWLFCLGIVYALSMTMQGMLYGNYSAALRMLSNLLYMPLAYVVCILILKINDSASFFLKTLIFSNVIFSTLVLIQSVIYNKSSKLFLTIFWVDNVPYMRNGRIRITEAAAIILLMFIISYCMLFISRELWKINFANCILSLITLLYSSQTRQLTLIAYVVMILVIIYKLMQYAQRSIAGFIFFIFFIIVAIACFLIFILFNSFNSVDIFSLVGISKTEKSYVARYGAVHFFIHQLHWLYGTIVEFHHGQGIAGLYYTADIGVLGNMADYGILSGIVYVLMIVDGLIRSLFIDKRGSILLVSMIIMLMMQMGSMSVNYNTYMPLAIVFSLIDFYIYKKNQVANQSVFDDIFW